MPPIKNLCYRTDAIFHVRDGFIDEHADYFAVRTPSNPTFWFGNFILFKKAPTAGDLPRWLQVHEQVFGSSLNHLTFGWDEDDPGTTSEFIDAGFKVQDGLSLSMESYEPCAATNPDLAVRKLRGDSEWQQMVELQIEVDREDFLHEDDGGTFRSNQMKALRAMAEDGQGDWWGAFNGEELVGGMGLYFDVGHTLGRFQYVTTRSTHRRQRVCTTLLDHVVRDAFEEHQPEQLVINTGAEDSNPAIRVYENFGFTPAARAYALTRRT